MTLEGWVPEIGPYLSLAEVIEFAFDYRGNTTVVKTDGTEIVGYIFNRDRSVPRPFVQLLDEEARSPITIPYADIATIRFTGKDTAAGNSWKAWLERRDRAAREAHGERSPDPHGD